MKEVPLNLEEIRAAGKRAREEIKKWPAWKQQAVEHVSRMASSEEALEALEDARRRQ